MSVIRNRNPIDGDVGFSKPGPHSFPGKTTPVPTEIRAEAPLSAHGWTLKLTKRRGTSCSIITSGSRAYAKCNFGDSFFDLHSEETKAQQAKKK